MLSSFTIFALHICGRLVRTQKTTTDSPTSTSKNDLLPTSTMSSVGKEPKMSTVKEHKYTIAKEAISTSKPESGTNLSNISRNEEKEGNKLPLNTTGEKITAETEEENTQSENTESLTNLYSSDSTIKNIDEEATTTNIKSELESMETITKLISTEHDVEEKEQASVEDVENENLETNSQRDSESTESFMTGTDKTHLNRDDGSPKNIETTVSKNEETTDTVLDDSSEKFENTFETIETITPNSEGVENANMTINEKLETGKTTELVTHTIFNNELETITNVEKLSETRNEDVDTSSSMIENEKIETELERESENTESYMIPTDMTDLNKDDESSKNIETTVSKNEELTDADLDDSSGKFENTFETNEETPESERVENTNMTINEKLEAGKTTELITHSIFHDELKTTTNMDKLSETSDEDVDTSSSEIEKEKIKTELEGESENTESYMIATDKTDLNEDDESSKYIKTTVSENEELTDTDLDDSSGKFENTFETNEETPESERAENNNMTINEKLEAGNTTELITHSIFHDELKTTTNMDKLFETSDEDVNTSPSEIEKEKIESEGESENTESYMIATDKTDLNEGDKSSKNIKTTISRNQQITDTVLDNSSEKTPRRIDITITTINQNVKLETGQTTELVTHSIFHNELETTTNMHKLSETSNEDVDTSSSVVEKEKIETELERESENTESYTTATVTIDLYTGAEKESENTETAATEKGRTKLYGDDWISKNIDSTVYKTSKGTKTALDDTSGKFKQTFQTIIRKSGINETTTEGDYRTVPYLTGIVSQSIIQEGLETLDAITHLDGNEKKSTATTYLNLISTFTTEIGKSEDRTLESNNTKLQQIEEDLKYICDPCPSGKTKKRIKTIKVVQPSSALSIEGTTQNKWLFSSEQKNYTKSDYASDSILSRVEIKSNTISTYTPEQATTKHFNKEEEDNIKESDTQDLNYLCDPCPNPTFKKRKKATTKLSIEQENVLTKNTNLMPTSTEKIGKEKGITILAEKTMLKVSDQTIPVWTNTHGAIKAPLLTGAPIGENELQQITEGVDNISQTDVNNLAPNSATQKSISESINTYYNNKTGIIGYTTHMKSYFNVTLDEENLRHIFEGQTFVPIETPPTEPSMSGIIIHHTTANISKEINMEEKEFKEITESPKNNNMSTTVTSELQERSESSLGEVEENEWNEIQTYNLEGHISHEFSTRKATMSGETNQNTYTMTIQTKETDEEVEKNISHTFDEKESMTSTKSQFTQELRTLKLEKNKNKTDKKSFKTITPQASKETEQQTETQPTVKSTHLTTMYRKGISRKYVDWYHQYPEDENDTWPILKKEKTTSDVKADKTIKDVTHDMNQKTTKNDMMTSGIEKELKKSLKTTVSTIADDSDNDVEWESFATNEKETLPNILKTTMEVQEEGQSGNYLRSSKKSMTSERVQPKSKIIAFQTVSSDKISKFVTEEPDEEEKTATDTGVTLSQITDVSESFIQTEYSISKESYEPIDKSINPDLYTATQPSQETTESDGKLITTEVEEESTKSSESGIYLKKTVMRNEEEISSNIPQENMEPRISLGNKKTSGTFAISEKTSETSQYLTGESEKIATNEFTNSLNHAITQITAVSHSFIQTEYAIDKESYEPTNRNINPDTYNTATQLSEEWDETAEIVENFTTTENTIEDSETIESGTNLKHTVIRQRGTKKVDFAFNTHFDEEDKSTDISQGSIEQEISSGKKQTFETPTTTESILQPSYSIGTRNYTTNEDIDSNQSPRSVLTSLVTETKEITHLSEEASESINILTNKKASYEASKLSSTLTTRKIGENNSIDDTSIKSTIPLDNNDVENTSSLYKLIIKEEEITETTKEDNKSPEPSVKVMTRHTKPKNILISVTGKSTKWLGIPTSFSTTESDLEENITEALKHTILLQTEYISNTEFGNENETSKNSTDGVDVSKEAAVKKLSKEDLDHLFEGVILTPSIERMPTENLDYQNKSINIYSIRPTMYKKGADKKHNEIFSEYPAYEEESTLKSRTNKYLFSEKGTHDKKLTYFEPSEKTKKSKVEYNTVSQTDHFSTTKVRESEHFSTLAFIDAKSEIIDTTFQDASNEPEIFTNTLNPTSSLTKETTKGDKLQSNIFSTNEVSAETRINTLSSNVEVSTASILKETDEEYVSEEIFEIANITNMMKMSTLNGEKTAENVEVTLDEENDEVSKTTDNYSLVHAGVKSDIIDKSQQYEKFKIDFSTTSLITEEILKGDKPHSNMFPTTEVSEKISSETLSTNIEDSSTSMIKETEEYVSEETDKEYVSEETDNEYISEETNKEYISEETDKEYVSEETDKEYVSEETFKKSTNTNITTVSTSSTKHVTRAENLEVTLETKSDELSNQAESNISVESGTDEDISKRSTENFIETEPTEGAEIEEYSKSSINDTTELLDIEKGKTKTSRTEFEEAITKENAEVSESSVIIPGREESETLKNITFTGDRVESETQTELLDIEKEKTKTSRTEFEEAITKENSEVSESSVIIPGREESETLEDKNITFTGDREESETQTELLDIEKEKTKTSRTEFEEAITKENDEVSESSVIIPGREESDTLEDKNITFTGDREESETTWIMESSDTDISEFTDLETYSAIETTEQNDEYTTVAIQSTICELCESEKHDASTVAFEESHQASVTGERTVPGDGSEISNAPSEESSAVAHESEPNTSSEGSGETTAPKDESETTVEAPSQEPKEESSESPATEGPHETTEEEGIKESVTPSNEAHETTVEGGSQEPSASNEESVETSVAEGESKTTEEVGGEESVTSSNEAGETTVEGGSQEPSASNEESVETSVAEGESETPEEGGDKESKTSSNEETGETTAPKVETETTEEGEAKESDKPSNEDKETTSDEGNQEPTVSNEEHSETAAPEGESETTEEGSAKESENPSNVDGETTAEGGSQEPPVSNEEPSETAAPESESETTEEGSAKESGNPSNEDGEITTEGGSEEPTASVEESSESTAPEGETSEEGGARESENPSNENGETTAEEGAPEGESETTEDRGAKESVNPDSEDKETTAEENSQESSASNDELSKTTVPDGGNETTEEGGAKENVTPSEVSEETTAEGGSQEPKASNEESSEATAPEGESEITEEGGAKESSSNENAETTIEGGSVESSTSNTKSGAPESKITKEDNGNEAGETTVEGSSPESFNVTSGKTTATEHETTEEEPVESSNEAGETSIEVSIPTTNEMGETTKSITYETNKVKESSMHEENSTLPEKHTQVSTQNPEVTSTTEIDIGMVGFESTPCKYCHSETISHEEDKTETLEPMTTTEYISTQATTEVESGVESEKEKNETETKESTIEMEKEFSPATETNNEETSEESEGKEVEGEEKGEEGAEGEEERSEEGEEKGPEGEEEGPEEGEQEGLEKPEEEAEKEVGAEEGKEEAGTEHKTTEEGGSDSNEAGETSIEVSISPTNELGETRETNEIEESSVPEEHIQVSIENSEATEINTVGFESTHSETGISHGEEDKTETLEPIKEEGEEGETKEETENEEETSKTAVTEHAAHKPVVIIINHSGNKLEKLNQTILEGIIGEPIQDVNIQYIDINTGENGGSINKNQPLRLGIPYESCKKVDYLNGQNCFCNIQSYLDTLLQKINHKDTIKSKKNYCNDFLRLKSGLLIESSIKPIERKRRGLIYLENLKKKGEHVEYETIEGLFENEYQLNKSELNLFCLPGETVKIRCSTRTDENGISWKFRPLSSSKDELLQDKEGELVLHSVSVKNTGNYTCSKEDEKNVSEHQHWHELELITFPIYNINLNIFYKFNDSCSLKTGDVLYTYLPKIVGPLLCPSDIDLCSVDVERPRCLTRADDNFFNVTMKAKMSSGFLSTIKDKCDINCKLRVYENLVNIIYTNTEVLERVPVYSKLDPSRTIEFLPNVNSKEGSPVSIKPPKIMVFCPGGFGLESKRQSVCVACPAHTFSAGDEAFCQTCPGGQYQPDPGSISCIQCNSPVDNEMCLRMLYTDTKLFKIYVGVAFGFIVLMVILIIVWTSGQKDDEHVKNSYFEGSLRHRAIKRKDHDVETGVREPLLGRSPRRSTPPKLPPVDF